MFAPSPIQFQYDNAGLLGRAAAQSAGQGRDLAFLNDEMNRRAQTFAMMQSNDMEGQKLQLAHDQMLQRSQSGPAFTGKSVSPFAAAISQAKQLALSQSAANVSTENAPLLHAAASDPTVDAPQFIDMLNKETSRNQKEKQDTADQQAKADVLSSAAGQIAPEDKDILAGYVKNSRFTANDLRIAVQQSSKKQRAAAAISPQQTEKTRLYAGMLPHLSEEDQSVLGPLLNDQTVTTAKLAQAMQQRMSQSASGARADRGQQLTQLRFEQRQAAQQANVLEKGLSLYGVDINGDENQDAVKGDPQLLSTFRAYQDAKQKASGIQQQANGMFGQQFQVGQILPTPKGNVRVVGFDTDGHPLIDPTPVNVLPVNQ